MKKDLTLPTLVSVVVLLAFSSVGATYAWYQYNANVIIDYNGTSIGSSTVFEVGLVSETPLEGYEDYGLVREQIGDKDVYWCASEVTTNISKYYLSSNGYSTNYLNGVTSGKFSEGSDFSLKRNPVFRDDYVINSDSTTYKYAARSNYAHFSLVFKSNTITPDGAEIEQNSKISLKVADISSEGQLKNSMRIYFASDQCSFIYNPSSKEDGYTTVGGLLDLNNDGVYDTREMYDGQKEIVYGEYTNLTYQENVVENGSDPIPLGGDGNVFNADHKNGVYPVDLVSTKMATSSFLGNENVITGSKILSQTNNEGLAFLNMDIYLEGWDNVFVNDEMNHKFGLGLEFECK